MTEDPLALDTAVLAELDNLSANHGLANNITKTRLDINNLVIYTDRIRGNGSGGTFVFEGEFEVSSTDVRNPCVKECSVEEEYRSVKMRALFREKVLTRPGTQCGRQADAPTVLRNEEPGSLSAATERRP